MAKFGQLLRRRNLREGFDVVSAYLRPFAEFRLQTTIVIVAQT